MLRRTQSVVLIPIAGLAFLAGCSDSTATRPARFNTARVEAGVSAIQRVAASPVIASLQAVTRTGGVAAGTTGRVGSENGLRDAVQRIVAATTDVGTALIPVMRESVLGKTFVWNATTRTYAPDAARTGAPPNGVRFILYETAANGDPVPGREVGYADLTDERRSSASTAGVKLVVVSGGITRLSYSFDLTGSLAAATFDVQGFLSDGTERVDFTISTSQQLFGRGGKATLDATLSVPNHNVVVTAKVEGTAGESDGDGKIDLTIRSGADEIKVAAKTTEGQLDASFTVNGQLLATATGDPHAPSIRGAGGRDLTDEELHALGEIVGLADGLFKLIGGLLAPAAGLLLIALGVG